MLKQGSDFLFEIAVIRDNRSRDNEGQLYTESVQLIGRQFYTRDDCNRTVYLCVPFTNKGCPYVTSHSFRELNLVRNETKNGRSE